MTWDNQRGGVPWLKRDKSMIAYEVRIKLNSGGGVQCESEPADRGKWIIDTKDLSSRRVCRRVLKQVLEF